MANLSVIVLPTSTREQYVDFINRQIIPDPPDELREIYEMRVLTELSYLKAEMYDSPEHADDLRDIQEREGNDTVPRNIQNPNFTRMLEFYDMINQEKNMDGVLAGITKLKRFLESLNLEKVGPIEYEPGVYDEIFDVRCCSNLGQYFNYLLTRKHLEFQTC